jgi:hypothetical protein
MSDADEYRMMARLRTIIAAIYTDNIDPNHLTNREVLTISGHMLYNCVRENENPYADLDEGLEMLRNGVLRLLHMELMQ